MSDLEPIGAKCFLVVGEAKRDDEDGKKKRVN